MEPQNVAPNGNPPFVAPEPDSPRARPPQFAQNAVRRKKIIMLSVLGGLAALAIAGAAYWFFFVKPEPAANTNPTPAPAASSSAEPDVAEDPTIATYKSSKLNIEFSHLTTLLTLPHHHRDPFDRLLIAQAVSEKLSVITSDRHFDAYKADIIKG